MANMSYCRWENTSNALRDCMNAAKDHGITLEDFFYTLSIDERRFMLAIMQMAQEIVELQIEGSDPNEWQLDAPVVEEEY